MEVALQFKIRGQLLATWLAYFIPIIEIVSYTQTWKTYGNPTRLYASCAILPFCCFLPWYFDTRFSKARSGITKKCSKQESLNLFNCSLLSFFLMFSITLRCDRHVAFDGKCSSIGILTLKHVEGVVVYKLNKIKLVKI